jgi:hypothetical protein
MGENLPEEAPFPLTDVDKWILSQTDEEFHCHDWDDLKDIIGELSVRVAFNESWTLEFMACIRSTDCSYMS